MQAAELQGSVAGFWVQQHFTWVRDANPAAKAQ